MSSDLRRRQMASLKALGVPGTDDQGADALNRKLDAKAAKADAAITARSRAAHAAGRTKAEQVRTRHANMPSNARRGRG